jgi:5-(carboxyamino)imidazole ribonucleotide synthase
LTAPPGQSVVTEGWRAARGPRVGILGAGQLARMLALAGYPLGIQCILLDDSPQSSGAQVAPLVPGAFDQLEDLERLRDLVDVMTFDIENIPASLLHSLGGRVPIFPPPRAIATAQDRVEEKTLFQSLGIPTTGFVRIDSATDLAAAPAALGWPIVLKARRLGYDGRGQRIAQSAAELAGAWRALGEVPSIAEAWVPFEREVSLIGARGANRETVFYPLAENTHVDGILRTTLAPFVNPELQSTAECWLTAIFDHFQYRGILTVEFFMVQGALVANEMAPRVHNSGHWTIEGAETSQFENHLRAILGWPLGAPAPRGHVAMVNLLGSAPAPQDLLRGRGVHVHLYGKEPRALRKLGHCTLIDADRQRLLNRMLELQESLSRCG